ncbi:MAG: hypothetical protein ACKPKO_58285, partial [Candidatus Fonsibacter sp.]
LLMHHSVLIRNAFYDKLYINGLIANYYTNSQVNNLLSGKQNTITASTNLTINKLICNNFEPTTVNTDMIIKANRVLFGDTITHTLLSGAASYFYSVAEFRNIVYFCDNIEVGYRDANDMFVTRFYINKNGNAYTYGNFDVAGNLSAPHIYNKSQVDNILNGKQNTITSSTDLTINKLICNNFEPTTVNTDMIIKANRVLFGDTITHTL